jgi:hypothetical protein
MVGYALSTARIQGRPKAVAGLGVALQRLATADTVPMSVQT